MSKKLGVVLGIIVCLAAIAVAMPSLASKAADNETIYEGVFIGKTDVGGMTLLEAEDAAKAIADSVLSTPVTLNCEGKTVDVLPEVIGLKWVNTDIAEEALELGRCGNLIKRYKDQKDLKQSAVEFKLIFTLDEELYAGF